jgi:hypothetical protein
VIPPGPAQERANRAQARPKTRADCADGPRPCPWISCRHHLYLEVHPKSGSITLNYPDVPADELDRLPATCALDVAEQGGLTLEEVGQILGLTRERVRQIESTALGRVRRRLDRRARSRPETDDAEDPADA